MESSPTESVRFSIGPGYRRGLNQNQLTRGLRAAFQKQGIQLSQNASVFVEEPDHRWQITDEEKRYTIRRTENQLVVSVFSNESRFPIVGVGASAGGLEAFTQLLQHLPTDTGMAFVLVQHLSPDHQSLLTEILSRTTPMPVQQVTDGMPVEPNCVYVIPPNTDMSILHGVLHLLPRETAPGPHMPIDYFFRSLAEERGRRAIGVILSGTASDGTLGLKAIKGVGGITFAQDQETATYSEMPRCAQKAGCVDFILPPEEIASELVRIGRHPYVNHTTMAQPAQTLAISGDQFNQILISIRRATGVDFTNYKQSTIKRRIARRMVVHQIDSLSNYLELLQKKPEEIQALYDDLLINVTGFFRNPETFQSLAEVVFPRLMENRSPQHPIRIWVPGCSTGEEAYSIAICVSEYLEQRSTEIPVQIFATDISEAAIDKARRGVYLENITQEVSPERLKRFFVKVSDGYQISKPIREICIFAKQDVTRDAPFSKLDLISCRNVLIYFGPVLQKRVIPIFHYALNPTGFLMLGSSETIAGFVDLFALVDKTHKIYSKKKTTTPMHFDFSTIEFPVPKGDDTSISRKRADELDLQHAADQTLLREYAPPGVVVNNEFDLVKVRGRTGAYLELAEGEISVNVLKITREGLTFDLRTALHKAQKENVPVRRNDIQFKSNGVQRQVNLRVIPIKVPYSTDPYFWVLFEESKPSEGSTEQPSEGLKLSEGSREQQLEQELAATKEYLQTIIEEQEAANEEFRAANEEIQSSNEELQSTNEELETAKEELQSTNEELENRNTELSRVNNDLINLLNNVNLPVLMLDSDLHIRRFTSAAEDLLNVISTDVGRKISDITPNVNLPDLEKLVLEVIETLRTVEQEIQDQTGNWYALRIHPYKTTENVIDGVVLTLVELEK